MTCRRCVSVVAIALAFIAGCAAPKRSSAGSPGPSSRAVPEVSPSGDIPDNQAYVPFTDPAGTYRISIPEGWSRSSNGATTTFTDKLNAISVAAGAEATAPTVASIRVAALASLRASTPALTGATVTAAKRHSGPVILLTYRAPAAADPVTGKTHDEAVEAFYFWRGGKVVTLTLRAPVGADNVDPWRKVSDSFSWTAP